MKKTLLFIFFILGLISCVEDDHSPEGVLKSFVDGRIGKVVTREFVLEKLSGKMRQSFENMNDEDFLKFADMRNVKRSSFKILSKSCHEKKCFLTYTVGYNTNNQFQSEVKKIAEIVNQEGKWFIDDISNLKTYHESIEPINPLE